MTTTTSCGAGGALASDHSWFTSPPLQVHDWIRVPLAATPLVRSRHFPLPFHWKVAPLAVHIWFAFLAVQSQIWSFVPLVVLPPVTSRHLSPYTLSVVPL